MERNVVLYIAMSLDGYIAGANDSLDFLSQVEQPGEDYGYAEFLAGVDTVIWGRKTFDKVLSFGSGIPHETKQVFVISRTRTGSEGHAVFRSDAVALLQELKQQPGGTIYCDGGAELVNELLRHALIDQFVISVIPQLLGNGIRLFGDGRPELQLRFKRSIKYPAGLVQLWYDKVTLA